MMEHPKNILVADDEAGIREFLTKTLNENGFHAIAAKDGVEALRLVDASEEPIDVLIIDVVMPRLNGKELASTIQSHHPEMKIILISGYPDDFLARYGVPTERIRYLKKPFTATTLLETVRDELNR